MTKTCFKCGAEKPVDEFYRHPMMADGHLGKCKDCTKRDVREHRRAHLNAVLNYDRWRKRGKPRRTNPHYDCSTIRARYAQRHHDRRLAHCMVNNAVRDGRLKKTSACEDCGTGGRLHGHHDDYSQPLNVRWLCPKCHGRRHWKPDMEIAS